MLIATGLSYAVVSRLAVMPCLRITVIAPGIKWRSSASRPNAVEERDVLLRIEEAGHALVLCTMLPRNEGRAVDFAVIAYLGGTGIPLEQERLRRGAGGAQRREEK
jgi:hypothetical protein